MTHIRLTRSVPVPDPLRLERCRRAPELGPSLLFFSGGSALRGTCHHLIDYTHNSIHLITPFDSGGSSAVLRRAFHMLSVGDIRNRIMALADRSVQGNPEVTNLFAFRFPKDAQNDALHEHLDRMIRGRDDLVSQVTEPMQVIIRNHLRYFRESMPFDFDLRGASIGNLILVGGYVNNGHRIDPVIYLFSRLVKARGIVRATANVNLHLGAELADGTTVLGQHVLTGKETSGIASAVKRLFLSDHAEATDRLPVRISPDIEAMIARADLICFPPGSFWSSIIANLLPDGVADAVAANGCPKIYVPNTAGDREAVGMSLTDHVRELVHYLGGNTPGRRTLDVVVVDSANGDYGGPIDTDALRDLDIQILDVPLVTATSKPLLDPARIAEVVVSLGA